MRKTNDNVNHSQENNEDGVLDLIHTVMHQYRSKQYQALRDGPHDITHMEGKVLSFFGHHPGATQSELAKHSGRDKAQLARLIKGLRDQGLLDAVADEADKRNVRLTLTIDGQSVLTTLRQQAKRLNTLALKDMASNEQQELLQLLRRVQVNLNTGS
ncbi:MarR family winged helix-turn-helix transcriptional regulator [Undibacterium sp. YM2]|uniref:MarR family winged helix-turn-helix transcriptional regulator n=1 Tax=Undibacterium sp. YM2 TaxID=2058625 RepID=UPI001389BAC3|nr:MarR family transcriptional regulator [Undibacterium sp. YM2]